MRTILIWARMFHVEHSTLKFSEKCLTFRKFWRGRASSSATTIFVGTACAILRECVAYVKSFLRVWCKLFTIVRVFVPDPVPTLVVYRQSLAMSRIICGKSRDNF